MFGEQVYVAHTVYNEAESYEFDTLVYLHITDFQQA